MSIRGAASQRPPALKATHGLLDAMCFFPVVSAATESVVEFFPSREQAEAFVAEVERRLANQDVG